MPTTQQIKNSVTNGLGYRQGNGSALRGLYKKINYGATFGDTELDLQRHLLGLDAMTAEYLERTILLKYDFALEQIAKQLSIYEIRKIKTPEYVSLLLTNYFSRKSNEKRKAGKEQPNRRILQIVK